MNIKYILLGTDDLNIDFTTQTDKLPTFIILSVSTDLAIMALKFAWNLVINNIMCKTRVYSKKRRIRVKIDVVIVKAMAYLTVVFKSRQ